MNRWNSIALWKCLLPPHNYRYDIESTPLNYILDKKFLINEIKNLEERVIEKKFINFTILKDENEINIFF